MSNCGPGVRCAFSSLRSVVYQPNFQMMAMPDIKDDKLDPVTIQVVNAAKESRSELFLNEVQLHMCFQVDVQVV